MMSQNGIPFASFQPIGSPGDIQEDEEEEEEEKEEEEEQKISLIYS